MLNFMRNTLSVINNGILQNKQEFVLQCEREYVESIYALAQIIADNDDIKIVSLAGPSGSGKTTSAHILQERLTLLGEKTAIISLDDFYLPGDKQPVLPNGKQDIESVNALDKQLIKKCLNEVIISGATFLPEFDFKTKTSKPDARKIDIGDRGIVIVEGLHALNPVITDLVPRNNIYKVYVSVNEGIFDDEGNKLLSSRQIRLMRRTLRDEVFRGTDVNKTLTLWEDVVLAERKYLYCFKETADFNLKTLHFYEPCLYKKRFSALLERVDKNHKGYDYFLKTVKGVSEFYCLEEEYIPEGSLIREFIGNPLV